MSETVKEEHKMACPKCGEDDAIDVVAMIFVRLTPNGSSVDDSADGSHEWDDDSAAICRSCHYQGVAGDFRCEEAK